MTFGILVKTEGGQPFGLLLHFEEEPTRPELASRVQAGVQNYGLPYSWQVHELNRSRSDAREWSDRNPA